MRHGRFWLLGFLLAALGLSSPAAVFALLPAPNLSSPAAGATGVATATSFAWSTVSGANRYWLTVATSSSSLPTDPNASSCPGCVISCTTTAASHTAGTSCTFGSSQVLAAGTTYHWRVQAWNTNGTQGDYSTIRNFTTATSLLPAPSLNAPANGATGLSTTPSFSWSTVSGANRYWLTVATSSGSLPTDPFATTCPSCVISCTTTSASHTAGSSCSFGSSQALNPGSTYFWRVQAWNTNGTQGNYSSIRNFSTATSLLPAPTLSAPANGATGLSTTPSFSWSTVSGANRYWLTVATSSGSLPTDPFTTTCPGCVISCTTTSASHTAGSTCSFGSSQALNPGSTYFWRAQAWNTNGTQGNYSSIWNFSTQAAGTPDIRISPLSLTFGDSAASFPLTAEIPEWASPLSGAPPARVAVRERSFALDHAGNFASLSEVGVFAEGLRLTTGQTHGRAETRSIELPEGTSFLGIQLQTPPPGTDLQLFYRLSGNDSERPEWNHLPFDDHLADEELGQRYTQLLRTDGARFVELALALNGTGDQPLRGPVKLAFIAAGSTPAADLEQLSGLPAPSRVSRTAWGCPDGQNSPSWPPTSTTVTHLIVHHTDSNGQATDWPAEVRGIWAYHTYTKGWGDIGYNYLIDPNGVIYEGRAGGERSLGAHFSCRNAGTQGVALLGNYSALSPTVAAQQSLKSLLAWIATQEGVDPLATLYHANTQLNLDTISGHRDGNPSTLVCSQTVCPGNTLYGMLPQIRSDVAAILGGAAGQSFTIFNDGTASLSIQGIQAESSAPWIQWTPAAPFSVPAGGSRLVEVTVDMNLAPSGNSTRRLLVTSNDPDESPYPNAVQILVERPQPTCFELFRQHTGSGSDPVANPSGQAGCSTGQYPAGTNIQLTASPSPGWSVAGWSGTNDDGSVSTNNWVTMPAGNWTAVVHYVQLPPTCFLLTRTHQGSGGDPVASPANSPGCPSGQYSAGTLIQVTASPAPGWTVGSWTGTQGDASAALVNTVSMPEGPAQVSVNYLETQAPCLLLTVFHAGSGSNPTTWPASSPGCASGQFSPGTEIELTASPAAGWGIERWTGTTNNNSTAVTNTVIMPSSNHSAGVHYLAADLIFADGFESGDFSAWVVSGPIGGTLVLFADDFDDGILDPSRWNWYGNTVRETGGQLQVNCEVTDQGGGITTKTFRIARTGRITVSRLARVAAGNHYFDGTLRFELGTEQSNEFGISYADYQRSDGYECPVLGFAMYRHGANSHLCAPQGIDVTSRIPGIWGTFFDERLEWDPATGAANYYINGQLRISMNVGILPAGVDTLRLRMSTWGWFTGHYQHSDNFRVTQEAQ